VKADKNFRIGVYTQLEADQKPLGAGYRHCEMSCWRTKAADMFTVAIDETIQESIGILIQEWIAIQMGVCT
jgi:hypothetical protein